MAVKSRETNGRVAIITKGCGYGSLLTIGHEVEPPGTAAAFQVDLFRIRSDHWATNENSSSCSGAGV
jgi:hypothetical protein